MSPADLPESYLAIDDLGIVVDNREFTLSDFRPAAQYIVDAIVVLGVKS